MRHPHPSQAGVRYWILGAFLLAASPLHSQYGRPISNLPPANYRGTVREISDDTITLELYNSRTFKFKRSASTKFYKEAKEIVVSDLHAGDWVSVDAKLDGHNFLVADKVTVQPEADQTSAGADEGAVAPREQDELQSSGDDPVLRRGSSLPELAERDDTAANPDLPVSSPDPLIEKAREAVFSFADKLPDFICSESMARFTREPNRLGWQPLDVVSAEVVYEDGNESYRDLKVNQRPTNKKMEELSGAWSTGEWATTLLSLFHPETETQFRFGEESKLLDLPARIYDFGVEKKNSHWTVQSGSRMVVAAYKGSVWIEPQSGRVLRIEIQAVGLPRDFPLDQVESAVDYGFVSIGGNSVLLPVHAESLGCERGSSDCSRNVIDFRNYRKYAADSKITFDP